MIQRDLNGMLPADIAVTRVEPAPPRFHARHDARARTYVYQVTTHKSAFLKPHVWWIRDPLDVPLMARAARMIEGRHDFACFRAEDPGQEDGSTVVVVESARVEVEGNLILFRIEASHFLWRMVRRLVGVLVKVGRREVAIEDFARLLEARSRPGLDVAAWTAPASGLFLESVRY